MKKTRRPRVRSSYSDLQALHSALKDAREKRRQKMLEQARQDANTVKKIRESNLPEEVKNRELAKLREKRKSFFSRFR